jgi:hypothetical protein
MIERSSIWEPIAGIDSPCADISFAYDIKSILRVVMHFSHVKDGPSHDLELLFSGAIGLRWAPEYPGSIVLPTAPPLPKCRTAQWSGWTFPLLTISESPWLAMYQGLPGTERRQHFSLIAMNDLLDVIAFPEVAARWIVPE